MTRNKPQHPTQRGFATPELGARADATPTPNASSSAGEPVDETRARPASRLASAPMVEIEVIHQHGSAPHTELPFQTLEVWTQNNVYVMDPSMLCVVVRDRKTQRTAPEHPFLGRRLVGGQSNRGDTVELSYPFPRPGTEAVFEYVEDRNRGGFSQTSTVVRVVLRLHVVTVTPNALVPTWSEITHNTGQMPAYEADDEDP